MKAVFVYKGGDGSGFHGHAGVPGKRGGSAPAGAQSKPEDASKVASIQDDLVEASRRRDAKTVSKKLSELKAEHSAVYETMEILSSDNEMTMRNKLRITPKMQAVLDTANTALSKLQGKTLRDILPADTDWKAVEGSPDDDALQTFAIGEYTTQERLLQVMGNEGKVANHFVGQLFDGDYSNTFFDLE